MKKQTATEWLFAHLLPFLEFSDPKEREHFRKCLAEAKAMEEEQSFEFWLGGMDCAEEGGKSFEQYYNETYGGERSDEIGSSLNWNGEVTQGINHIVDTNEMIDHIGNATKMVDYVSNVEKLAEEEYPIFDGDLLGIAHNQQHSRIDFIKGYNKAKETLFTEEQVREAIDMARELSGYASYSYKENEIIQSLKQPKK